MILFLYWYRRANPYDYCSSAQPHSNNTTVLFFNRRIVHYIIRYYTYMYIITLNSINVTAEEVHRIVTVERYYSSFNSNDAPICNLLIYHKCIFYITPVIIPIPLCMITYIYLYIYICIHQYNRVHRAA